MSLPPSGPWPPPPNPQPDQPQGGPSQWGPPPQWSPQPPPQSGGNRAKWILGALAFLVVVVVTVVTTLLFTRDGSVANPPTASLPPSSTSVDPSEIASANDDGPVGIILDDPTCAAWTPIGDTLAQQEAKGWNDRDPAVSASAWSPEQRRQHEAVANAMRAAADQTVALVKLTPHRVIRELYEQSIAYWRAYADRVPSYEPADDHLARVATSTSNALVWICSAITYQSAAARSPFVVEAATPLQLAALGDPANPSKYVTDALSVCGEWQAAVTKFQQDTADWLSVDPNLSASEWTPEQQSTYANVTVTMQTNADRLQDLGIKAGNPTFQDFATLAAQYRRAYVSAIPSYRPADNYLASVASQLVAANAEACLAAGG